MKDNNYETTREDSSEEEPILSNRDLEAYLKGEGEESQGGDMPPHSDSSRPILASLKEQQRSRRSLMRITLLCVGLGILGLVIFFVLKPEKKELPPIVEEPIEHRITSPIDKKEALTIPEAVGKAGSEEKEIEGAELEGVKPEIEVKEEEKSQTAMVERPKDQAILGGELPTDKYTINVGSFREHSRAERFMNTLKEKGYKAFILEASIPQKGSWYRVSVGRFATWEEAQAFAQELKEKEKIDYFVRNLKETKR